MYALTSLIPAAATAVSAVANQVQNVMRQGSPFSRVLQSLPSPLPGTIPPPDATVPGTMTSSGEASRVRREVVRQQLENAAAALHARLTLRFAEQGIDLSQPIVLCLDCARPPAGSGGALGPGKHRAALRGRSGTAPRVTELLVQAESLAPADTADGLHSFPTWVIDGSDQSLQGI